MNVLSPFARASQIWEQGYSIIPIMPRGQIPAEFQRQEWQHMPDWARFCRQRATETQIELWNSWPNANIGLACGPAGGVIGLDFDEDTENLHARIQAMLPPTDVKKVGSRGHTAFYRYSGEKNRDWKKNGVTVLQLLSEGRQTVLPPSIHPKTGKPYYYSTEDTFEWIAPNELPCLPPEFCEMMDELFGQEKIRIRNIKSEEYGQFYGQTTMDEIYRALSYIPADSYQDWVNVGMALRHHLSDVGYPIWDEWSRKSPKYNPNGMERKWRSFKNAGITIATLFYYAMDNGYIPQMPGFTVVSEVAKINDPKSPLAWAFGVHENEEIINDTPQDLIAEDLSISEPATVECKNPTMPRHLYNMPGLAGRIATWINVTALYPQPMLAMGAALVFVGTLKGHRVRTEITNTRSNIYIVAIAESGSGKDHPIDCIVQLAHKAGIKEIAIGEPTSGPALLNALYRSNGRAFCTLDEIGLMLQTISGKNAAGHKKEIITNLMRLYGASHRIWIGTEYAGTDDKTNKRRDIDQPSLSVFGASTRSRFFDALTSGEVIDGFLNRMCVIESDDPLPLENTDKKDVLPIPEHVLRDVRIIHEMPTNPNPTSLLGDAMGEINPKVIVFEPEARDILDQFKTRVRSRRESLHRSANNMQAMWVRAVENAIRIALILQEGNSITGCDMKWAIDWVEYWTHHAISQIQNNVADNEHARDLNKVMNVIRNYCEKTGFEWMPHKELSRRTSKTLRAKDRDAIIRLLLESEEIEVQEIFQNGQPAKKYRVL